MGFDGELLALCATPKAEDRQLAAVRVCLFNFSQLTSLLEKRMVFFIYMAANYTELC
jgi:hypothetical protein